MSDIPPASFGDDREREFDVLEAELGALARELTSDDVTLFEPPPEIWAGIEAATLGHHDGGHPQQHLHVIDHGAVRPLAPDYPSHDYPSPHDEPSDQPAAQQGGMAPVVNLGQRRRGRNIGMGLMAAAAAIALGFLAGSMLNRTSSDTGELVAQTAIANDDLPVGFDQSGTASVRRDGDDLYLQLDLPELPDATAQSAFYEVWLIDTDVVGMISLGAAPADGRIDLPDNIDYQGFPVVDVSVEPFDGDPTHSGQSILRGVLAEA